jgi:sporulation integral membrane protein YlbJ
MRAYAHLKSGILALLSLMLVLTIILFPKQAYESSLKGLTIWWEVVFPALLPFFITAELLIGFGVVRFIGVLLEPIMRYVFRVPGAGGFALSMGLASGYPMGARLTVQLRQQNLLSRSEGERLVSITSTSGPLFMFGAVAVGFFKDATLGILIATSHYLSAFMVGILMRFHDTKERLSHHVSNPSQKSLLFRALQAMHRARIEDGRALGQLMGDAVISSVQTLLMIGGFIILFSVITNSLSLIGIVHILSLIFSMILFLTGIDTALSKALILGLFEMTLGTQEAGANNTHIPLVHKVAIASAIISWSGLSVHAQVVSLISKTDIRYLPYLFSRICHAIMACITTYVLWSPFQAILMYYELPVMLVEVGQIQPFPFILDRFVIFIAAAICSALLLLLGLFLLGKAKQEFDTPM